jgi:hypothetical protein
VLQDRRSECEVLDRLLEAVRGGESRILVVRGDPGVGKSALLEYVVGRASGCALSVAFGLSAGDAPDHFLVSLAALSLLAARWPVSGRWCDWWMMRGGLTGRPVFTKLDISSRNQLHRVLSNGPDAARAV